MKLYIFFSALAALALKFGYDFFPEVRFEFQIDWFWFWFWALLVIDAWLIYSVTFFLPQG